MPHIWVASDFIRSTLDLFAYDRASDHALVIGAGLPASWIDAKEGVAISGMRTAYGALSYRVRNANGHITIHIDKGAAPPGGFVFESPYENVANARVNGKAVQFNDHSLGIASAPADVTFDVPTIH
jgi:hypothetical protein